MNRFSAKHLEESLVVPNHHGVAAAAVLVAVVVVVPVAVEPNESSKIVDWGKTESHVPDGSMFPQRSKSRLLQRPGANPIVPRRIQNNSCKSFLRVPREMSTFVVWFERSTDCDEELQESGLDS